MTSKRYDYCLKAKVAEVIKGHNLEPKVLDGGKYNADTHYHKCTGCGKMFYKNPRSECKNPATSPAK